MLNRASAWVSPPKKQVSNGARLSCGNVAFSIHDGVAPHPPGRFVLEMLAARLAGARIALSDIAHRTAVSAVMPSCTLIVTSRRRLVAAHGRGPGPLGPWLEAPPLAKAVAALDPATEPSAAMVAFGHRQSSTSGLSSFSRLS